MTRLYVCHKANKRSIYLSIYPEHIENARTVAVVMDCYISLSAAAILGFSIYL